MEFVLTNTEDMDKFLNAVDNGIASTPTITVESTPSDISSNDSLFNKYVIIGSFLFFGIFLISVIVFHLLRLVRDRCCQVYRPDLLYSQLGTSEVNSILDESDSEWERMYTTCHLQVDDTEVNTAVVNFDDFEYDSRSIDVIIQANGDRDYSINQAPSSGSQEMCVPKLVTTVKEHESERSHFVNLVLPDRSRNVLLPQFSITDPLKNT